MTIESRVFRIDGKVQGVGYRAATLRAAESLGVTGWVCNLRDGSVEVLAHGNEEQLASFHNWLERGPAYAQVDTVTVKPGNSDKPPSEFRIR